MDKSQARGYLLEIVLSKLIEVNGYELILKADGQEIVKKHNGLNVRGRGGFHQFDSLGRFKITPPFIYPLRLFVEAKFYSGNTKVGIGIVRAGIGILQDVNTNYSTVEMDNDELLVEKYHYNYAIFSTNGFTEGAQRLAIAHKIYLIDLSGDEYKFIIDLITCIVDLFFGKRKHISKKVFASFRDSFASFIRNEDKRDTGSFSQNIGHELLKIKDYIENKQMYLATISSPYIIPLFSTNSFNQLLSQNPHQPVSITWEQQQPDRWIITPNNNNDIRIPFTLPTLLHNYLFSDLDNIKLNAMDLKERRFDRFVFIAYLDNMNPTICTLKFDKESTMRRVR